MEILLGIGGGSLKEQPQGQNSYLTAFEDGTEIGDCRIPTKAFSRQNLGKQSVQQKKIYVLVARIYLHEMYPDRFD